MGSGDYKSLPIWRQGIDLAHAVYAAVEAGDLREADLGRRVRKAAVSIPSLIAEAWLDPGGVEARETVFRAEARLSEIRRLLTEDPVVRAIPESERASILRDLETLGRDLETFSSGHVAATAEPS
jgi:four helix bundle protein